MELEQGAACPYPSALDSLGTELDTNLMRKFQQVLLKSLSAHENSPLGCIKCYYWLSFLSWHLDDKQAATEYGRKADSIEKSDQPLKNASLSPEDTLFYEALKEKAFFYSSLGPRYYRKTVELYEQIIDYNPSQDVSMWRYLLGRIHRRLLNISSEHTATGKYLERISTASNAFYAAIKHFDEGNYAMRSWINLSELRGIAKAKKLPNTVFPPEIRHLDELEMLEEARRRAEEAEDAITLYRCGTQYQRYQMYNEAIALLEKALKIKETAEGHLQISLAMKSKVLKDARIGGTAREKPQVLFRLAKERNENAINEIEQHFQKSIELEVNNAWARINFGFYLQETGKTDEAINTFSETLNMESCWPNGCVQCYEKLADCFKQKSQEAQDLERKRTYEQKSKLFIIFSVEASADILLTHEQDGLTLGFEANIRNVLLGKKMSLGGDTKGLLKKDIDCLQGLMARHSYDLKKASPLFQDVMTMDDSSTQNLEGFLSMAEIYMQKHDFSSAIILLDIMQLFYEDGRVRQLNFKAHLNGASDAAEDVMACPRLAHDRFRNSFPVRKLALLSEDSSDVAVHVCVLSSASARSKDLSKRVAKLLRGKCGLNVALNTDYPAFNTTTQWSLMDRSYCVAIVLDGEEDDDCIFSTITLNAMKKTQDQPDTKLLVINVDEESPKDDQLSSYPRTTPFPGNGENGEKEKVWIRSFFTIAMDQNQNAPEATEGAQTGSRESRSEQILHELEAFLLE